MQRRCVSADFDDLQSVGSSHSYIEMTLPETDRLRQKRNDGLIGLSAFGDRGDGNLNGPLVAGQIDNLWSPRE